MGLLGKLFARDPAQQLARVEELLAGGHGYRALELAEKLARSEPAVAERAQTLAAEARRTLVDSALAKASTAEEDGHWEDAADWLLSALQHLGDDPRAAELESLRQALLDRADEERSPLISRSATDVPDVLPDGEDEVEHLDAYDTFCWTFADWIVGRYEEAGPTFRQALVAFNDGDTEGAIALLGPLATEAPDDPLYRLELGRFRLAAGHAAEAMAELDVAWQALGSEALDHGENHSIPGMWAEAALEADRAELVVERLRDMAEAPSCRTEIAQLYASALVRLDPPTALPYLERAHRALPSNPVFPLLASQVLARLERHREAIDVLEASVEPTCRGGSCSRPGAFLPSLRALAGLHLGPEGSPDRARELLAIIAGAHGGRLGAAEHTLLARYYELEGNAEAAARSAAEAERLSALGEQAESPAPTLSAGRDAVL